MHLSIASKDLLDPSITPQIVLPWCLLVPATTCWLTLISSECLKSLISYTISSRVERSTLSYSVITFSEREPFLRGFLCWIFDFIAQWHKWKRRIIKCRHLKYHPIYMKDQSNLLGKRISTNT